MKKKYLIGVLVIIMCFLVVGCGKTNSDSGNSSTNNSKEYKINGKSIKLDSEDDRDGIKYNISKSFEKKNSSSATTYYLYNDDSKDKYDVSNIAFSVSVTANIMQSESAIETYINKLNTNSSLKNITREKKTINDKTWEYVTLDNYYESGSDNHFKNHSYYYETYDGKYYTTYIVSFNKVDNNEELENDFMNNITFTK